MQKLLVNQNFVLVANPPFILSIYRGDVDDAGIDSVWDAHKDYLRKEPGKMASVVLIDDQVGKFQGKSRDKAMRMSKDLAEDTAASAIIIKGTGLTGAFQRSIVTSFNLLMRSKYPMKVFSNIPDGSVWIVGQAKVHLGYEGSAQSLAFDIQAMAKA